MSRFDRSSNPAMNAKFFEQANHTGASMTINGAIHKIAILTVLVFAAASFTWKITMEAGGAGSSLFLTGIIGGLIMAIATIIMPSMARFTAPFYAIFEGLAMGSMSALAKLFVETQNSAMADSVILMAIMLTIGTLIGMLLVYRSGVIKVTERFKAGVVSATLGVCFAYFFAMLLSIFGLATPLQTGGIAGIGLSLVVVAIAAFNLILDFDAIVKGAQNNAPQHYEWYAAFSMMVTLIWLYVEIVRLLMHFAARRD